jgi:HEPN domain-containing protein
MSNARQALNAAREANAEQYAEQQYKKAKELLEEARVNIENGDYYTAKNLALEAKSKAIQAKQDSQNSTREK